VIEVGGLTGKNVYVVNLWLAKRALPHSIPEVLARRDEIVFAEKIRRNIRTWEYIDDYRQLVEEIMASVEPNTAAQIRRRPRYIETVGETCPLSVTRINREPVEGESLSRDYEFSRKSIDQLIAGLCRGGENLGTTIDKDLSNSGFASPYLQRPLCD
jgi:NTE family protein